MKSDYFDSQEFKELLERYEASEKQGTTCFLDAFEYCDLADYYVFKDRIDEALEVIRKGQKSYPDEEGLNMVKAGTYIALHRFQEARDIIHTLNPDESNVLYMRAQLVYALDNDIETAEELFTDWIEAEEEMCKFESDEEKEDRSRDAYLHVITSFIDLRPDNYDVELVKRWVEEYYAHFAPLGRHQWDFVLADLIRNEGLTDMIEKLYISLLETDPYIKSGWMVLSAVQVMNGHYQEALESADFALAIDPDDIHSTLNRGHALYALGNREEAYECFKAYLSQVDDQSQYLPFALCLIALNRTEEAEEYLLLFKDFLPDFRDQEDYYFQSNIELAQSFIAINKPDEALQCINRCMEIDSQDSDVLLELGTVHLMKEELQECSQAFTECLQHANNKVFATVQIAYRFIYQNQIEIALHILDTADTHLADDPDYRIIDGYRTLAYYMKEDTDNFLLYLKKSCQTCPDILAVLLSDKFPPTVNPQDYYEYVVNNPV